MKRVSVAYMQHTYACMSVRTNGWIESV